jgi:hypothetical protein
MNMSTRLFIGSSTEGKQVARAVQAELADITDPEVWDQGTFVLNRSFLEGLIQSAHSFDFAVIVATADDFRTSRGEDDKVPRDNVIFEIGLFLGALGRDKAFLLVPSDTDIKLPSDLAGINLATYKAQQLATNAQAAVGPACTKIRETIKASASAVVEDLSGIWYAAHLSRDEKGAVATSWHEYELEFSESGQVTGTMEDKLSKARWIFQVEGAYTNEGILALILRTDKLGLLGAQFHYMLEPDGKNIGVIASYDRQNVPFTTLIVLSQNHDLVEKADLVHEFSTERQSFIVGSQLGK